MLNGRVLYDCQECFLCVQFLLYIYSRCFYLSLYSLMINRIATAFTTKLGFASHIHFHHRRFDRLTDNKKSRRTIYQSNPKSSVPVLVSFQYFYNYKNKNKNLTPKYKFRFHPFNLKTSSLTHLSLKSTKKSFLTKQLSLYQI